MENIGESKSFPIENVVQVIADSLEKAQFYSSINHYGRAFAHYLVYLELCPEGREVVEKEFMDILYNWTHCLEELKHYDDLIKCYLQGIRYFPRNVEILNNFGAHLIKLEDFAQAQQYFKAALSLDQDYLPAEKNLLTLKLNAVPRWHFRMLNDLNRNKAYKNAIVNSIDRKFNKVLDVGTGTGILSLFATLKKEKTASIHGIECSPILYKVAKKVLKANKAKSVKLSHEYSTAIVLKEKANLLITEIFDTALFGERILGTLIHAHEHLLEKDARIVPKSATLHVAGVESLSLYRRHKYLHVCNLLHLNEFCLTQMQTEPYDAENLKLLEYKLATTKTEQIDVDFRDLKQLKSLYENGGNAIRTLKFQIRPGMTVHAFVVYFDLHLDDSGNRLTTNPNASNSECWEQAVFYVNHPISSSNVDVKLSAEGDELELTVINDEPKPECDRCYKVSKDIITFLNDGKLVNSICDSTKYFIDKLNMVILDMNPFPIFALQLLLTNKCSEAYCLLNQESDALFLKELCLRNKIDNLHLLNEQQVDGLLKKGRPIFDAIFINPIAEEGIIYEKYVTDILNYQSLLRPAGLILPESVRVVVKLVESKHLSYFNKANDEHCFGFRIARIINEYAVAEQWMVKPNELPHKSLSKPVITSNIMQDDNNPIVEHYNLDLKRSGTAHGILYWYNINYISDVIFDTYNSTHYNSACYIFDREQTVVEGNQYKVTAKQHKGLLKIY